MNQVEAMWLRSPITSYRYCFSSTDVAFHCETTADATKEVFPGRKETVHHSEGRSYWKVCQILSVKDDGAESGVSKCEHPGKSWWPRRRDRVERCMHFWRCQVQTSRLADCRMLGMESHGKSTGAQALFTKQVMATISLLTKLVNKNLRPFRRNHGHVVVKNCSSKNCALNKKGLLEAEGLETCVSKGVVFWVWFGWYGVFCWSQCCHFFFLFWAAFWALRNVIQSYTMDIHLTTTC